MGESVWRRETAPTVHPAQPASACGRDRIDDRFVVRRDLLDYADRPWVDPSGISRRRAAKSGLHLDRTIDPKPGWTGNSTEFTS
jgi:hypothetical protein